MAPRCRPQWAKGSLTKPTSTSVLDCSHLRRRRWKRGSIIARSLIVVKVEKDDGLSVSETEPDTQSMQERAVTAELKQRFDSFTSPCGVIDSLFNPPYTVLTFRVEYLNSE